MAATNETDSYTVAETAKVLGRTPKRVRQMMTEGKLVPILGTVPVRIASTEVMAMRQALRNRPPQSGPKPQGGTGLTIDEVMSLVDRITSKAIEASEESHRRATEARDRAEDLLKESLAAERQRADALAAEVSLLRDRLYEAPSLVVEAPKRRGWFRR
jgi:hypothetical protein